TDQRVIVMEHRVVWLHQALRLDAVESIPWANVQELRMKGIFAKKLRLRAQGERGPKRLDMKVPNAFFGLLAPMRNNMAGARSVANAFQSRRGLPGAPATLPPTCAPYGLPQGAPALAAPGYGPLPPRS